MTFQLLSPCLLYCVRTPPYKYQPQHVLTHKTQTLFQTKYPPPPPLCQQHSLMASINQWAPCSSFRFGLFLSPSYWGDNAIRVCSGHGGVLELWGCLGGMVCVRWHPHKYQDPGFPSRILNCSEKSVADAVCVFYWNWLNMSVKGLDCKWHPLCSSHCCMTHVVWQQLRPQLNHRKSTELDLNWNEVITHSEGG